MSLALDEGAAAWRPVMSQRTDASDRLRPAIVCSAWPGRQVYIIPRRKPIVSGGFIKATVEVECAEDTHLAAGCAPSLHREHVKRFHFGRIPCPVTRKQYEKPHDSTGPYWKFERDADAGQEATVELAVQSSQLSQSTVCLGR